VRSRPAQCRSTAPREHNVGGGPRLDEAVHAAGDERLAVRREARDLRVALLSKLDRALEERGEALHLVARAGRLAAEQVERGARRQQALVLLPARARARGRPTVSTRRLGGEGAAGRVSAVERKLA